MECGRNVLQASVVGASAPERPRVTCQIQGRNSKLLDKGYAEKVLDEEIGVTPGQTWYLPHHNVVNKNKPEKLRIVFDCARR